MGSGTEADDEHDVGVLSMHDQTVYLNIIATQLFLLQRENSGLRRKLLPVDDPPARGFPIRSLPAEIVAEVFKHCADGDHNRASPRSCPLLLLRVCRLWRDIASSTPALWSTFNYDLGYPGQNVASMDWDALFRATDSWLSRAGSRTLDVSITELPRWPSENDTAAQQFILRTLQQHGPRIARLHLQLYHSDFQLLNGIEVEFSQLEELGVSSEVEFGDPTLQIFAHAKRLRKVHLEDIDLPDVPFPRHQVQEFSSEGCMAAECLYSLQVLPNLTTCLLQPFLDDLGRNFVVTTHTRLRRLTLAENDDDLLPDADPQLRPTHILEFLTLPALESLEIRGTEIFDGNILRAFLERSSPPLQRLAFVHEYRAMQISGSLDALLLLSKLEQLEFERPSSPLMMKFCVMLMVHKSCLPRLKDLMISDREDKLPDVPSWVERLGRSLVDRASLCLESVRIVLRGRFTDIGADEILPALEPFGSLKRCGVKVHIGTRDISAL
uniref:F-box domain-containing protein n=1 Tax=Mycena chlorophos TaxID=658473 RepID=A0ABQ0LPV9_MYCCL|nr:predicted protein [Mycena chlorophos]